MAGTLSRMWSDTYLDRINEIDKNGPKLNSIIQVNPDALQIAEELDKELAGRKVQGSITWSACNP